MTWNHSTPWLLIIGYLLYKWGVYIMLISMPMRDLKYSLATSDL